MIRKILDLISGIMLALVSIVVVLSFAELFTRIFLWPAPAVSDTLDRLEGYTIAKPQNTIRILVLGDSIAYGWGVRREDTFSKQLEKLLSAAYKGKKKIEVINTGLSNTNTVHQFNILNNFGALPIYPGTAEQGYVGTQYKPDLILVSYCLNDVQPANDKFQDVIHNAVLLGNLQYNIGQYALPLPKNIDRFLSKYSRFYRFILIRYDRLLNKMGLRHALQETLTAYNDNSDGWHDVRFALAQMSMAAMRNNIKISMFIWPSLIKDMDNNYAFGEVHNKVKSFAVQIGIYAFDLRDIFRKHDGTKLTVSSMDAHPNAFAHKMTADAMYHFIRNNRLLPELLP